MDMLPNKILHIMEVRRKEIKEFVYQIKQPRTRQCKSFFPSTFLTIFMDAMPIYPVVSMILAFFVDASTYAISLTAAATSSSSHLGVEVAPQMPTVAAFRNHSGSISEADPSR